MIDEIAAVEKDINCVLRVKGYPYRVHTLGGQSTRVFLMDNNRGLGDRELLVLSPCLHDRIDMHHYVQAIYQGLIMVDVGKSFCGLRRLDLVGRECE